MAEASIECGFCCRKIMDMDNPIRLPCDHVHCHECINGFYDDKKILRCPQEDCRKVVGEPIDNLKPYGNDDKICDICLCKQHRRRLAIFYCRSCENYYCQKHKQAHEGVTLNHIIVPLSESETQTESQEEDKCERHTDQVLSLGCRTCFEPYCIKCVSELSSCQEGNAHKLMSLQELTDQLQKEDMTREMAVKEEQFEHLFKETSKAVALHDEKTNEGLQRLRKTKTDHLQVIKEKYDQLEIVWLEHRGTQKEELTDFLEDEVIARWNQIRDEREAIESTIKQARQVEMLKYFNKHMTAKEEAASEDLPKLEAKGSVSLVAKEPKREIELELAPANDVIIAPEYLMMPPPKEITLKKTIELPAIISSLHFQDGYLYAGMWNNNIARIDRSFNIDESFITCSTLALSIAVCKDEVYALLASSDFDGEADENDVFEHEVCVYDMSGNKLAHWRVSCYRWSFNILAVVSGELVVADLPHNRLTVFSQSGQILRHFSCTLPSKQFAFMCAADGSSVIISEPETSTVSRFNINTGAVEWSVSVTTPFSVCCYDSKYALVGGVKSKEIQIIDVITAPAVGKQAVGRLQAGCKLTGSRQAGRT
ncbi:uncharacterized protein [Watersipora subatra]|uniref:uncharacterized protein n=1 Tax=Watersipora subatra TaxID=2589382 RepID=UPI00355C1AA2